MSEDTLSMLHSRRDFVENRIAEEQLKVSALGAESTLLPNYRKALGILEAKIFDAEMAATELPLRSFDEQQRAAATDAPSVENVTSARTSGDLNNATAQAVTATAPSSNVEFLPKLHDKRSFLKGKIAQEMESGTTPSSGDNELLAKYQKALKVVEGEIFDEEMTMAGFTEKKASEKPEITKTDAVIADTDSAKVVEKQKAEAIVAPMQVPAATTPSTTVVPIAPPNVPQPSAPQQAVMHNASGAAQRKSKKKIEIQQQDTRCMNKVVDPNTEHGARRRKRSRSPTNQLLRRDREKENDVEIRPNPIRTIGRNHQIDVREAGFELHPCLVSHKLRKSCSGRNCVWKWFPQVICIEYLQNECRRSRCPLLHLGEGRARQFRVGYLSKRTFDFVSGFCDKFEDGGNEEADEYSDEEAEYSDESECSESYDWEEGGGDNSFDDEDSQQTYYSTGGSEYDDSWSSTESQMSDGTEPPTRTAIRQQKKGGAGRQNTNNTQKRQTTGNTQARCRNKLKGESNAADAQEVEVSKRGKSTKEKDGDAKYAAYVSELGWLNSAGSTTVKQALRTELKKNLDAQLDEFGRFSDSKQ